MSYKLEMLSLMQRYDEADSFGLCSHDYLYSDIYSMRSANLSSVTSSKRWLESVVGTPTALSRSYDEVDDVYN
jgi:hypothetical protein